MLERERSNFKKATIFFLIREKIFYFVPEITHTTQNIQKYPVGFLNMNFISKNILLNVFNLKNNYTSENISKVLK